MLHSYEGNSVNDIWYRAVFDLKQQNNSVVMNRPAFDQTISTIELNPVLLKLTNARKRILTSRDINIGFALAEVLWIISGQSTPDMITWYNARFAEYLDDGETEFNAPYGKRLRRYGPDPQKTVDQLEEVYSKLKENPSSRQAVTVIWDPVLDNRVTRDVPCNDLQMFKIRDGKLNLSNCIRSNDSVFGTPYNFIQFTFIQEIIAGWLGMDVGHYVHFADSFHMYDYHIYDESINFFDIYNHYAVSDFRCDKESFNSLLKSMLEIELISRGNPSFDTASVQIFIDALPIGWKDFMSTIVSYNLFKHGREEEALLFANTNIKNEFLPVLKRFFYKKLRKWKDLDGNRDLINLCLGDSHREENLSGPQKLIKEYLTR